MDVSSMLRLRVHKMAAITSVCRNVSTKIWLCPSSAHMCQPHRDESTSRLTNYKRGRGGRSSFSGIIATVFGANGQLGNCVVSRLGRIGSQVIVPYRSEALYIKPLKVVGDLGQILFQEYHLRDEDSIRKSMKYSNVVINLIGRHWETKNFKYHDIYEHGPRRLARLAREMGVSKFIHVSDLKASHNPTPIFTKNGSVYLKAKMAGEEAVREEFPDAIIFRPAEIFGPRDTFINHWCQSHRRFLGRTPMWKSGRETIKQPVSAFNVAEGIVASITQSEFDGKTIQAVGPHRYYLADLVNYFYEIMHWASAAVVPWHPLMWLKVLYHTNQLQTALLSIDKLDREHLSDIVDPDLPTLEDLGVKLTRIEDRAPYDCYLHRRMAYYDDEVGEFPDPVDPKVVPEPRGYFQ